MTKQEGTKVTLWRVVICGQVKWPDQADSRGLREKWMDSRDLKKKNLSEVFRRTETILFDVCYSPSKGVGVGDTRKAWE